MLDKLFGNDDERDRDERLHRDRHDLVRQRMQADGISEEEATRLVLSEEQLAIGRQTVQAGEVEIGKHVETEHVRESVPLRHEEVTVERRPVTDGYSAAGATIGQDESIRIPIHQEEVVVEKRVVPTEELVVRKQEVVEDQVVEADLRRERADVHREGDVRERGRDDLDDRGGFGR